MEEVAFLLDTELFPVSLKFVFVPWSVIEVCLSGQITVKFFWAILKVTQLSCDASARWTGVLSQRSKIFPLSLCVTTVF